MICSMPVRKCCAILIFSERNLSLLFIGNKRRRPQRWTNYVVWQITSGRRVPICSTLTSLPQIWTSLAYMPHALSFRDFSLSILDGKSGGSVESDSISCRNALASEVIAKLLKNTIPNRTQSLSSMFHEQYPVAWSFHRNTCRCPHNMVSLSDNSSPVASFNAFLSSEPIRLPEPIAL